MSSLNTSPASPQAATLSRRERGAIVLALLGVTVIAWLYLLTMGRDTPDMAMDDMPDMAMPLAAPWTPTVFALTFAMWWVMMVGMMVPSAVPMVLTFATLNRRKRSHGRSVVPTSVF